MFKIQPGNGDTITKTIRMPANVVGVLERLAEENGVSFTSLVIQCVQYALQNMDAEEDMPAK